MPDLASETIETTQSSPTTLDHREIVDLLQHLPSWSLRVNDGVAQLEKVFRFNNFNDALDFTVRVGRLADEADHHPVILTQWGSARVTWWTHEAQGLLRQDFILAARTDTLYKT